MPMYLKSKGLLLSYSMCEIQKWTEFKRQDKTTNNDSETVVHIHNRILFSSEGKLNLQVNG